MTSNRAKSAGVDRIRTRSTFERIRNSGKGGASGPIRVKFVADTDWPQPRFAYAVGKKLGNAVVRNRIRRRLRAIAVEMGPNLPTGAYLVSPATSAVDLKFDELRMVMAQALKNATGLGGLPSGIRRGSVG